MAERMSSSRTLSTDTIFKEAVANHRAGELTAAEKGYRAVLRVEPSHAQASHNLGALLVKTGRLVEGLALLERVLTANRNQPVYYFSYAQGLLAAATPIEAGNVLREAEMLGLADRQFDELKRQVQMATVLSCRAALQNDPDSPVLYDNLGSALLAQGEIEEAVGAFRRALERAPDFADAHFHLGATLSQSGSISEGFAHYMRRAALVYGSGNPPRRDEPDPPFKISHDLAQRDYLAGGEASEDMPRVPGMFHLADGSRIDGPAINPDNATPELVHNWHTCRPQAVVLDNFLTPVALEKLRAYCAGSTVWRKIYTAGYLGAAPEDGFACPLLAQIVEEIQRIFQPILGAEQFRYLGAFKYDSVRCAGTNTHADNSIVNVNFYIAPDSANLDPNSGGMVIWDVAAPDSVTMRRLNGNEDLARTYLDQSGKDAKVIPHRCNRAVIFKSTQFHRTDTFKFKDDYLSHRINVSLLFGQFA